jgi:Cu+-exporting ATPase
VRAAGPIADPIPCSGCGKLLDPLRAGHVAIFDAKLHYFCSARGCRTSFLAPWIDDPDAAMPAEPRRASTTTSAAARELTTAVSEAYAAVVPEDVLPELPRLDDPRTWLEPIAPSPVDDPREVEGSPPPARDIGALLLLIAVVAGVLAILLGLAEGGRLVLVARCVLAGVGASMLLARASTTAPDVPDPKEAAVLAAPVGAVLVAGWAAFSSNESLGAEAASLAGVIVAASAISAWLLETARENVQHERTWLVTSLEPRERGWMEGDRELPEVATTLRPGETVRVDEGDVVPVDALLVSDEVEVLPWPGASVPLKRRAGDAIVAGAVVRRGDFEGVCSASGDDRAFARLVLDPRRRADALVPAAQSARSLAERWSFVAAAGAGGLTWLLSRSVPEAAMAAVAVQAGLGTTLVGSLASVHVLRGVLHAQRRGIAYRSADAWNRAANARVALFCARGTLLLGEPEVVEVEPLASPLESTDVFSLAAGAARADTSPQAQSILRAAKLAGVQPDAVRNATTHLGLGVVAVTSSGEELVVGTRALMLEQRVTAAGAERRASELEELGRSVVLVALSGRVVGLVALQDGIRPGARAAVQHLFDAQIEPVLMSADSRETCDSIARSLDIEHVRAEVLPSERSEEVKRLAETGASVAVLGHPGLDEDALGAADVAVALGSAGSPSEEYDVALASDELRDAALALALARRTLLDARVGFGLAAIPPALGAALVALGVLPPAFVPIAGLMGGAMAVAHGHQLDRLREPRRAGTSS